MTLPKNGDTKIDKCYNCGVVFEELQKIGSWITCPEDEGGCGLTFKLIVKTGHLESE